jgi:hypothetical protein
MHRGDKFRRRGAEPDQGQADHERRHPQMRRGIHSPAHQELAAHDQKKQTADQRHRHFKHLELHDPEKTKSASGCCHDRRQEANALGCENNTLSARPPSEAERNCNNCELSTSILAKTIVISIS